VRRCAKMIHFASFLGHRSDIAAGGLALRIRPAYAGRHRLDDVRALRYRHAEAMTMTRVRGPRPLAVVLRSGARLPKAGMAGGRAGGAKGRGESRSRRGAIRYFWRQRFNKQRAGGRARRCGRGCATFWAVLVAGRYDNFWWEAFGQKRYGPMGPPGLSGVSAVGMVGVARQFRRQ